MKILVTGSDGLLGRAVSTALRGDGHTVVGLSMSKGAEGSHFTVDVRRRDAVFAVVDQVQPDLTLHLAAMAHADVGPDRYPLVRAVNVAGTRNVADALEAAGSRELIFFSSAKVLADTTGAAGIDEATAPTPTGIYAECKREAERELLSRTAAGRLRAVVVRPVAVIGPKDPKGNYAKMWRMVRLGGFPLLDGGAARRSVVFSRTIAERIRVMAAEGLRQGVAYVFEDGSWSLREIVDAMRIASGYAFCPSVPISGAGGILKRTAAVLGTLPMGRRPAVSRLLDRLTASFVIRSHRFVADYGEVPCGTLAEELLRVAADEREGGAL